MKFPVIVRIGESGLVGVKIGAPFMIEEFTLSSKFRQKPAMLQLRRPISLSRLAVRPLAKLPGRPCRGIIAAGPHRIPCALGWAGIAVKRREGDGKTPIGRFSLVRWLRRPGDHSIRRPDSIALRPSDGWCDDPASRQYNRQVTLPFPASAERLWRDDALYDVLGVVDYNFRPRVLGRGSAIFLHFAQPDFGPTAGCVAVQRPQMQKLLKLLRPGARIAIGDAYARRLPKIAEPTRT